MGDGDRCIMNKDSRVQGIDLLIKNITLVETKL